MTDLTRTPTRVRQAKWIQKFKPGKGDGLCPGFWKGCPAVWGCPHRCSYCFLNRYRFDIPDAKLKPDEEPGCVLYPLYDDECHEVSAENRRRLSRDIARLYPDDVPDGERDPAPPDIIIWGETADSLACDPHTGFLYWLMDWAQDSDFDLPIHLLLTKSAGEGWLDALLRWEPTDKLIFSFSVTQRGTYGLYEQAGGAPRIRERWEAMHALASQGWRVRARIDPLSWYSDQDPGRRWAIEETKRIADGCVAPSELITLGTLRFNTPNPLIKQLGMQRDEGGRWRLPFEQRVELYRAAVEAIDGRVPVAACKETPEIWEEVLGHVPRAGEIRCNCTE